MPKFSKMLFEFRKVHHLRTTFYPIAISQTVNITKTFFIVQTITIICDSKKFMRMAKDFFLNYFGYFSHH
jgi:hypothetical protein